MENLQSKLSSINQEELIKKILIFKNWKENQRQIRLDCLYKSFNQEEIRLIKGEAKEMCYDENLFKKTGLKYSKPDFPLFEVALAEYLTNRQN